MVALATPQPIQPQVLVATPEPDASVVDPLPEQVATSLREHGPISVEVFYVDHSQPCREVLDALKAFQRANMNLPVKLIRRNAEVELRDVAKYNIDHTPTIVISKDDQILLKFVGVCSPSAFSEMLKKIADKLANSADEPPTLRYNGKAFEEWRTAWQTELSLEKRLEVVKALAAFGASGRGQEAAEAILDVANQLDWSHIHDSAKGRLQQACIDAFTSGEATDGYRIPTEAWWPLVVPIYEDSADKWTIVTYLSYQLPAGEKELIPKLLELSNKNEATQSLAISGLRAIDPKLEDVRVVARLRESLKDANQPPGELRGAINSLFYNSAGGGSGYGPQPELRWVPELQPLLFHPDPEVRQTARFAISKAQPRNATPLVEYLIKTLDTDDERERREAIRALAALDTRATPAEEKLKTIARDPKDNCRMAAAAALLAMWPDVANWDAESKLRKLLGGIESGDSDDISRKLKAEQDAVFGMLYTQNLGGGGMF
jgi:hypothetical protein